MDTSTLLFVFTLAFAFVVMRWIILPIPQTLEPEIPRASSSSLNASSSSRDQPQLSFRTVRNSHPVTPEMIELVQSIAPQLSTSQIRYDLERTGSAEATINRFMENRSLPLAPGEINRPPVAVPQRSPSNNDPKISAKSVESENLIKKFGLTNKVGGNIQSVESKWGADLSERSSLLAQRREEMILRARQKLEALLKSDVQDNKV